MLRFNAIKSAYRQTKEGYIVSLVIHPQEVPLDLTTAEIGTQWQITAVPLDEDGNEPK